MRALSGRKIIGLSSGDPNIDTDPRIIAAAERAMRAGRHPLRTAGRTAGAARGDRRARGEPIGRRLRSGRRDRDAGRQVRAAHRADGGGADRRRGAGARARLGELRAVRQARRRQPVGISMLDRIDEATLERVVTPRTKAIIVNSPVNPTGRVLLEPTRSRACSPSPSATTSGSCSTRSIATCSTPANFPTRSACPAGGSA